jgi:hypothetical protein
VGGEPILLSKVNDVAFDESDTPLYAPLTTDSGTFLDGVDLLWLGSEKFDKRDPYPAIPITAYL